MNGKINWPMSSAPNTYPEVGYFYVWVDTDKNLKAMDSDGNIQNLSARYFVDLIDVSINNLQDGQYLIYNSTSGKWENDFTDLEGLETLVGEIEAEFTTITSDFNSLTNNVNNNDVRISQNTSSITSNTTNITDNTNNIASNTPRINANENAINSNTAEITAIKGDIAILENEIDALNTGDPASPTEPVDTSTLIDENGVTQAEAVDGFLKVNNRLKFAGASIRIGEGTGEADNAEGTGGEIAIGTNACFGNAAKTNGIGIGIQALYNVSGSANIGIGLNAGNGNSGNYNISLGNSAGQYRIISSSNINIGYASGYNGRGNDNIYLGAWCGAVPTANSIIENKMLRIGTKGGASEEYLDKELIIGNMDPNVDGGQWLLINGELRTKSPNGTTWAIKVDDNGNLSTQEVTS